MAINKYQLVKGKTINVSPFIYKAVEKDEIVYDEIVTEAGKRLDHYANEYYGDANNWWIIAAASGIGWWMQVPAGVVLRIPLDLEDVMRIKDNVS
jgi:hypothetical protein